MKSLIYIWLSLSIFLLISEDRIINGLSHPDIHLSLEERVKRHGYPLEHHVVETEDDYILSLYRLPHGTQKQGEKKSNKSVVVLAHGMGACPHYWFYLGRKRSIPYYLVDRGFDVWILAVRGDEGFVGKRHKKYNWNEDSEYWNFSLHEIGVYDFSAQIDYITAHTNQSKVFFIGHSAAWPEFFILLSERPEYNEKIKLGVSYASSPIIKRSDYTLLLLLCSLVKLWRGLFKYLGWVEGLPLMRTIIPTLNVMCQDPMFTKMCRSVVGIIGSHNSVLMDDDMTVLGTSNVPRISSNILIHFMENVKEGRFAKFDHGRKRNMKLYGQPYPPEYNLSSCTVPVAFFYASKDSICVKSDVYDTMNHLPNVILDYEIPFKKFTHLDFVLAKNASELVYEPSYKLFRDYDEGKLPAKIGKRSIPED